MRVPSRLPRVWVAGGLAVTLVAAGGGFAWLRGDGGIPHTQRLGDVTVEHRWSLELPDPGDSDPGTPQVVVEGGSVFVAQYGRLRALDATTGEQRWNVAVAGYHRGIGAADGAVALRRYVGGADADELVLFDGATGQQRWDGVSVDSDDSDPVIAEGVVIARGVRETGGLRAFDAATGERRWNQPAAAGVPCWTGSAVVTLWRDNPLDDPARGLVALSVEDGRPSADPVATEAAARVVCSAGAVVAMSDTVAEMHLPGALDAVATLENDFRSATLVGETTLVADAREPAGDDVHHTLVAYDATAGEERWRYRTPAVGADDRVRYQQVGGGIVVANDPGDEGGGRRFTQLLDGDGRLLGDITAGVEEPSVLETASDGGSTLVVGDAERLVGFRVTSE